MKKLYYLVMLLVLYSLGCNSVFQTQLISTPQATPVPATPTTQAQLDPIIIPLTLTPSPVPTPTPLPGLRIAAGDRAFLIGDYDTALTAYTEALQNSSDSELVSAALTGLGRIYLVQKDTDNALRSLREVIERFPDNPHRAEAFFFLAQTYESIGRPTDAADAYLNYLLLRPGVLDGYIYEKRGDALTAAGNFAAALLEYQAAQRSLRLQTDFSLEIKLARAYARSGDYPTALVMFDDIYARSGSEYTKAQLAYLKGQVYLALGQVDSSQAAYLDAVQNYPAAYDSYLALVELVNAGYSVDELQRGIVDYFAGEYGVAIAALDRYLANAPSDLARAYYYKGLALNALSDHAAAITFWDLVIRNYPGSTVWDRAYEQKAYILWAFLDQYAEAEQTLLEFVNTAPSHPRAAEFLFDAARVAERAQQFEEAIAHWERLANEYPQSTYAFNALIQAGVSEYRRGDYAAAQAILLRAQGAATTVADASTALLWVGKTYQALGDSSAAASAWQQAAVADPTGYYSERARDLISGRQAFSPPQMMDLGYDLVVERQQAEDWLRQTFSLPAEIDLSSPGDLANDPRLQRGQEFWRLGLYVEALLEFDNLRVAAQNDVIATYRLANALVEVGAYRPAILAARQVLTLAGMNDAATLSAPVYFNRIRFGTYYSELIIPLAQAYNFHPLLVWSLMRQESLFDRAVASPAGALGLMQIMPTTGQELAGRLGWPPNYKTEDLNRPIVSIRLGLDYLDDVRRFLNGDLFAALAAYNGGPGNAQTWKSLAGEDPDLFLEIIRFDEPRRYIKGIYEMFNIYRILYGRTP